MRWVIKRTSEFDSSQEEKKAELMIFFVRSYYIQNAIHSRIQWISGESVTRSLFENRLRQLLVEEDDGSHEFHVHLR